MSKSNLIEQIMGGDERLRDAQSAPLSTDEAQSLIDAWDAFLMYLCGNGFDLADLPLEAIEAMARIEKITKEQENEQY